MIRSDSEKAYSDMVKDYDPEKEPRRKSINDIKEKIECLLSTGCIIKEISDIVNYNEVSIRTYCVKTWGNNYQKKLKGCKKMDTSGIYGCTCSPIKETVCQGCLLNKKNDRINYLERQVSELENDLEKMTALANKNSKTKFNKEKENKDE